MSPQEYWTIDVDLDRVEKPGSFTGPVLRDPKKRELHSEAETQAVTASLEGREFRVLSVKRSEKKRSARAALYHLHPPAGGLPEAGHDAQADHGPGPAAL